VKRTLRDNGLSLVLFGLFFVFVAGQSVAGHVVFNQDQREHHEPGVSYLEYLGEGEFVESVFENWESEFLQMFAYVLLTAYLVQRGSAESKRLDETPEDLDAEVRPASPKLARAGSLGRGLYAHSLSLMLGLLFLASFAVHALGGAQAYGDDQQAHGSPRPSVSEYVTGSQFWFESLQNWQSEFLAVGSLVVLSIFLREKDSPESKRVSEAHAKTG
jgi:Domain of unknown function (DUF6766)